MTSTAKGYLAIKKQTTDEAAVKPTNFIRCMNADITKVINQIKHSPLQNSKRKTLYMKDGGHQLAGEIEADFDFNESVWNIYGTAGSISSADISSATDTSVIRHTITVSESDVPAFSVERAIGNTADATNNKQNYLVKRAIGVKMNETTIEATAGEAVKITTSLVMLAVFDQAILKATVTSGSSKALTLDDVEGLTTGDTVGIFDGSVLEEDPIASMSATAKTITIATLGAGFTKEITKVELAAQTPSYSTPPQNAALYDVKVQMADDITAAASAAETNWDSVNFKYNNDMEEVPGTIRKGNGRVNSQRPVATIEMKKIFTNKAEYDTWLRVKKQAIIVTIDNGVVISATDTNNATYKTIIKCPQVVYDAFEIPTDNNAIYEVQATLEVLQDATAGYAVQFVCENAKAGTYYTA